MRFLLLAAAMALVIAPAAEARVPLSKRTARAQGLRFVTPYVDMLDLERTVATRMVPARECSRVSPRTVTCRFSAWLEAEQRTVTGWVRVHRQRDGLLGFLLPDDF